MWLNFNSLNSHSGLKSSNIISNTAWAIVMLLTGSWLYSIAVSLQLARESI